MRVAIVHYWLCKMRGGEAVIEALCEMFPEADLFTHVYDEEAMSATIRKHRVTTTFINKLPAAKKLYQTYLPLMPHALEALDLSAYDLVISSESGPAKGVITRPDALHLCYCHSPMRYLWDQYHAYRRTAGFAARLAMPILFPPLRQWDVTSAARVDHFIANSTSVAERIRKYWRREADVIAPPVSVARFGPKRREDFYLYVGELAPYKRADLAIEACTRMHRKLVVIGDGSEAKALQRRAGPSVTFLGRASDEVVADHYARCRAFLFPAEEDFGIVAVEAMASGRPVIAFGRGGARDSVIDGETGLFFQEQSVDAMAAAITRFEARENAFDDERIQAHARQFSREAFKRAMARKIIALLGDDPARAREASALIAKYS